MPSSSRSATHHFGGWACSKHLIVTLTSVRVYQGSLNFTAKLVVCCQPVCFGCTSTLRYDATFCWGCMCPTSCVVLCKAESFCRSCVRWCCLFFHVNRSMSESLASNHGQILLGRGGSFLYCKHILSFFVIFFQLKVAPLSRWSPRSKFQTHFRKPSPGMGKVHSILSSERSSEVPETTSQVCKSWWISSPNFNKLNGDHKRWICGHNCSWYRMCQSEEFWAEKGDRNLPHGHWRANNVHRKLP